MFGSPPLISSVHGVVAAAHPLAAQSGARILAEGGNAFDAAVAVAAALNAAEPSMSGLAGMGVATCWIAAENKVRVLNFFGQVPRAFPTGRFAERGEIEIGAHACGLPANLAGWCELAEQYGRLPLRALLAPGIRLARDGVPLIDYALHTKGGVVEKLRSEPFFDEWNRTYGDLACDNKPGAVLRQPNLAATFDAIAENGCAYLYDGPLGDALVACVQGFGGCITKADLANVRPKWQEPAVAEFKSFLVHAPPPPAEAFQFLLALRILDGLEIASLPPGGAAFLDIAWRAIRLSAGSRIAAGNPSAEELAHLLSDDNVAALRARVLDGVAITGPTEQWLDTPAPDPERGHTTSFSVADGEGNLVCVTQSLGMRYGCGIVVPGTGVCLNDFHFFGEVDPRGPNALRPATPFTLPLAPSIVTHCGRPVLAIGTPGGYGICQSQTQVLLYHLAKGMTLRDAVAAPRARLWEGSDVEAETRFEPAAIADLRRRGHDIRQPGPWLTVAGGVHAVAVDPRTGVMTGIADPRRDGYIATP
jgi:gamma-glutamyltranspeptidase/glutathione hydrolase